MGNEKVPRFWTPTSEIEHIRLFYEGIGSAGDQESPTEVVNHQKQQFLLTQSLQIAPNLNVDEIRCFAYIVDFFRRPSAALQYTSPPPFSLVFSTSDFSKST